MKMTTGLFTKLAVVLAAILMMSLLSCSGTQTDATSPELDNSNLTLLDEFYRDADGKGSSTAGPEDPPGQGGPGVEVPGIHDAHSAAEVYCMDCHSMHFGIMPTRDVCLGCHTIGDDFNHRVKKWECYDCHKS